jgi:hypothetical protein
VNPRFGSTQPRQNTTRSAPVTFTALFRIDVGSSRERQTLTEMLDRGRHNTLPRITEAQIKSSLGLGGVPSPVILMMLQADVMKLTQTQTDTLARLSRWFALHLDSVWTPVARALSRLPDNYGRGEAYALYQRGREQSFDLMIQMAPMAKAMLTPAQLRLLPAILQAYRCALSACATQLVDRDV